MLRMIGAICLVLFGIDVIYGWDLGYPSIDWIYPEEGIFLLKDTIEDVSFILLILYTLIKLFANIYVSL